MDQSYFNSTFTENDIRPERLKEGTQKAYQEDIDWLLERKSSFVEVNCPACGFNSKTQAFTKKDFDYRLCDQCETVYLCPRPPEDVVQDFYKRSKGYEFWNKYTFPQSEDARRKNLFIPRVNLIIDLAAKLQAGQGLFIEVGSGFGTFAEELQKRGYFEEIMVIEPSQDLAETCRKKGLNVINMPVEKAQIPEKADVIASFEVLEHLFDPREFLLNCRELLKKWGLLIITCPNIKGFDNVALGVQSSTIDHEHLNYFHPRSLTALFERCGFKIVDVSTPGKMDVELVRKGALSGAISLEGRPFLKQILLDEWERLGPRFQQFLAENQLSGHMWVVGQKLD